MEKPGLDGHGVLVLRVGHSYRIRRKTTYTLKLFCFSLSLSHLLPLPQAIIQALPFKAIQGEAGTPSRGINRETN
jgi:hypothetical protein